MSVYIKLTGLLKAMSKINMLKYQFSVIKETDEKFINEWYGLWQKAENSSVFNSYEWFLASKNSCNPNEIEIFTCRCRGKLVALLPVFYTRIFGIKVAKSLGYKFVGTPFLMEKYETGLFKYFFSEIISRRHLYISKVDQKAAVLLHKIFPGMLYLLISVNPYIDRRLSPDGFISDTSHKRVRKIVSKYSDKLKYVTYDSKDNLDGYLKIMFDTEQESAKKLRKRDLFSNPDNRRFFANIVKYCSRFVRLNFLYFDDKPIAYTFNFMHKNIFSGYQTSYLQEYRYLYPGKIIITDDLESLKNTPVDIFDFGGGVSNYKQEFTPVYYFLYDLYLSRNNFAIYWWKLIYRIRRLKQLIFPEKYTRDHEFLFKTLN
jgi:CelD/BcsL family acetyltransferase involved in cellulose biosynthesis